MCGYRNWQDWSTDKRFENSYECDGGVSCPGTSNPTTSTSPPQRCHKDGPNEVGHCLDEFICCEYTGNNSWKETQCRCLFDNVFDEVNICNKLNIIIIIYYYNKIISTIIVEQSLYEYSWFLVYRV